MCVSCFPVGCLDFLGEGCQAVPLCQPSADYRRLDDDLCCRVAADFFAVFGGIEGPAVLVCQALGQNLICAAVVEHCLEAG